MAVISTGEEQSQGRDAHGGRAGRETVLCSRFLSYGDPSPRGKALHMNMGACSCGDGVRGGSTAAGTYQSKKKVTTLVGEHCSGAAGRRHR